MSIYSVMADQGLLVQLPDMIFFQPTAAFSEWLGAEKLIIDCGCGVGLLSSLHSHVIGIDIMERRCPLADVSYGVCAIEYPFRPDHTVLIARPNHSGWHQEVFVNALKAGSKVVYVGLPKNYDIDLECVDYEVFMENAGREGEEACLIKRTNYE